MDAGILRSVFKKRYIYLLERVTGKDREREMGEKDREVRERILLSAVHFLDDCNEQHWTKLKSGARSFVLITYMGGRGPNA